VLLANGDGSWNPLTSGAPAWANQQGVNGVPGDYNGDGKTGIAFYCPGCGWGSVPVLFSNGDGTGARPAPPRPTGRTRRARSPYPVIMMAMAKRTSRITVRVATGAAFRCCSVTATVLGVRPALLHRLGRISKARLPVAHLLPTNAQRQQYWFSQDDSLLVVIRVIAATHQAQSGPMVQR